MPRESLFGSATKNPRANFEETQSFSRTPSITKTPGKKLFKRLFCGPSQQDKGTDISETDLEGPIDSNSTKSSPTAGEHIDRSIATAPSSSNFTTNESIGETHSFGSHPASSIQASTNSQTSRTMTQQSPITTPLPASPIREEKKFRVSSILAEGVQSPDTAEDDLYLPHQSSSFQENYSSPSATRRDTSYAMPMKTPGLAIPTPQTKGLAVHNGQMGSSMDLVFPHPLRTVAESPQMELTRHVNLSQSISESLDGREADNDDAFLPNDFKQADQTYTWEQVQRFVENAEQELKQYMEKKHQDAMEEYQEHMEEQLQVHGSQWKQDTEAEYERLNQMLKMEKSKTQQKHLELLQKVSSMADVEAALHAMTEQKRHLEARVQALEAQLIDESHLGNETNDFMINKLQAQLRDLQDQLHKSVSPEQAKQLQKEKEEAEEKVKELENLVLRSQNQMKTMEINHSMSTTSDVPDVEVLRATHAQEVVALKAENEAIRKQSESLKNEVDALRNGSSRESELVEELVNLKSEKVESDRKVYELNEELKVQKRLKDDLSATQAARLDEAKRQINALKQQLQEKTKAINTSFSSVASQEELFAAKAEVETLRSLRDEDFKEKEHLKDKLNKAIQSPRKSRESKLNIDTLTIELLPSPNASMLKDDDETANQMRSELEGLRAERDALKKKVEELEADKDLAFDELRMDLENQIEVLKQELDSRDEAFAAEKRTLQADLSVAEIEEFTSEVKMLKEQHQKELEEQRAQLTQGQEQALEETSKRMEEMRGQFEKEIRLLEESHDTEMKAVQKEIETLKDQFAEEFAFVQAKSKADSKVEIDALQAKLDKLRIEFEDEKIEIIRTSSKQADDLQTKLSVQQKEHEEELETLESKIKSLEDTIQKLKDEARGHERSNLEITEMRSKHEKELNNVRQSLELKVKEEAEKKSQLEKEISSLQGHIAMLESKHKEDVRMATQKVREELEGELRTLEASINSKEGNKDSTQQEADRAEFNRRIREVREEHSKEIDDLLKQLDLVEAEHNEKAAKKDKLLSEKESVISALGVQLAEAERKLQSAMDTKDQISKEMEQVRLELDKARSEIDAKSKEIQNIVAAHERVMQDEEIIREKLCDEAREEMIQRAEVQFKQANATYKKLKHEFDAATAKISDLEQELRASRKRANDLKREKAASEADLANELAEAKAAVAKSDLNATRKMKQYRSDLEAAKENEANLQRQLDEATVTSQSLQKTLAVIIEEKKRLNEENKDLKSVCEELMEIVEGEK